MGNSHLSSTALTTQRAKKLSGALSLFSSTHAQSSTSRSPCLGDRSRPFADPSSTATRVLLPDPVWTRVKGPDRRDICLPWGCILSTQAKTQQLRPRHKLVWSHQISTTRSPRVGATKSLWSPDPGKDEAPSPVVSLWAAFLLPP